MESILLKRMVMCKTEIFFQGSNAVERKRRCLMVREELYSYMIELTIDYSTIAVLDLLKIINL